MTQYLKHTTREDERWDTIAYNYYNDVSKMSLLIEENPHAPIAPTLPSGLQLRIPILTVEPGTQDLPPWK